MKRAPAILASCFLAAGLTACGGNTQPATTTPEPTTTTSSPSTTAAAQPTAFKVGDTVNVGVDGEIVNMTITEVQLGGECRYGSDDWGIEAKGQLLQLWAEVEPKELVYNTWTKLDDPEVITKDGFTQNADQDYSCRPSNEGHSLWHEGVDLGEKIRVYGHFHVPADFEALKFNQNRITFEDIKKASEEGAAPAAA